MCNDELFAEDKRVKKFADIFGKIGTKYHWTFACFTQVNQQAPQLDQQILVDKRTVKAGFEYVLKHSPVFTPAEIIVIDKTQAIQYTRLGSIGNEPHYEVLLAFYTSHNRE